MGQDTQTEPKQGHSGPANRYTAELADAIELRWQAYWERQGTFRQPNPGEAGFDDSRPKFYALDMFPYPSGAGLHVGHPEGYTASDIISRYMRMRGYNVLHPMGWDAFGLPAEQYAIQTGVHPAETTRKAIKEFRRQLKRFGFDYDWSREFGTIDPDYYKWTQWIFLRLYRSWYDPEQRRARPIEELVDEFRSGERAVRFNQHAAEISEQDKSRTEGLIDADGNIDRRVLDSYRLAYLAEQTVNWCPKLGTALANEEVIDGRSERGAFPVFRKPLKQWMLRITAYADRLLDGLDHVDWPESTRTQQREWIGRSVGAEVDFELVGALGTQTIRVFTTRPDTIFGATYMVVAPEHPLVDAVLADPPDGCDAGAVRGYVDAARNRSDVERQEAREKTGVPLGIDATNPATGERIPVWVADYVLMGYGHGAIMAVPAHDDRDHEFATKFGLPIREVVVPEGDKPGDGEVFTGHGRNINSANDDVSLDGLPTDEAKASITAWLESRGIGRQKVNYRLRDWLFSRQRYWGEPFPIVYDEKGNHHPVDDAALPVELPPLTDYQPVESKEPMPLLGKAEGWVQTTAGQAGVGALPPDAPVWRETNTMPGWAGSCWYFLRYCDPKNSERFVGREAERYWMGGGEGGTDLYIGGAEHAVLHLLYARFWHQVLHDLGEVTSPEPFGKLFHQGLITSFAYQRADKTLVPADEVEERTEGEFVETATGEPVTPVVAKMSKSLKNVINPDDVIREFGADTFRLYEMYMGPLQDTKPWNTRDTGGLHRFLQRAWRLAVDEDSGELRTIDSPDPDVEKRLHRTIAKVGGDIERLAFNTAIAAMIEFVNAATTSGGLTRDQIGRFARILSPFAPHIGEELWSKAGHEPSVAHAPWPEVDEAMLRDDEVELAVQVMGKVRGRVTVPADADEETIKAAALADQNVQSHVEGKTIRKIIVVPGRMVNIVAN